jgi:sugar diacid utilization regulator
LERYFVHLDKEPQASISTMALTEQLSTLRSLAILSMIMTDSRDEDEIFRLVVTAVPALANAKVVAAFKTSDGRLKATRHTQTEAAHLIATLTELGGRNGAAPKQADAWSYAYSLSSPTGNGGYIVVQAPQPPSADQQFLLAELAHHTGAALANAKVHHRLESLNSQLSKSVASLSEKERIHNELTAVAASGEGEAAVAEVVRHLIGLPVAVEDPFGNVRAWATPGEPAELPQIAPDKRNKLMRYARQNPRPTRDGDRIVALAQARGEVLGALVAFDPDHRADDQTLVAMEHGATVLAMELSRMRALAEMQLRMGRDLVEDLLADTDIDSVCPRAEALGFDLLQPFYVLAAAWPARSVDERLPDVVERALGKLGITALIGGSSDAVIILVQEPARAEDLYHMIVRDLASPGCIGVSGICRSPGDVPRARREAMLAMSVCRTSPRPDGVVNFDDLGIFQALWNSVDSDATFRFVRSWLGVLIDHDAKQNAELVKTLSVYLDSGGNYDRTANALAIHRGTLRYRLQRIRTLTQFNINDPETRLNLHVASRAVRVLGINRFDHSDAGSSDRGHSRWATSN